MSLTRGLWGSHVQGAGARRGPVFKGEAGAGSRPGRGPIFGGAGVRFERTEQMNFTGDLSNMCLAFRFAPHQTS